MGNPKSEVENESTPESILESAFFVCRAGVSAVKLVRSHFHRKSKRGIWILTSRNLDFDFIGVT